MLRHRLEDAAPDIYAELVAVDRDTSRLAKPNCSSKKSVKGICSTLKRIGYLQDFETYAEQIAALRADICEWPKCYCGQRVNMFNGIFRTFCSRKCSLSAPTTKTKIQSTNIQRYGAEHHWASEKHRADLSQKYIQDHGISIQQKGNAKRMQTWKHNYGCHPMQVPEIFKKAFRNRLRTKLIKLPSGKFVELMGYEPQTLNYMLTSQIWREDDFDFDNIPTIEYSHTKVYFPDFWLPSHNLLVEVKSEYTAFSERYIGSNILKEKAVRKMGYKFQLWIWNSKLNTATVKNSFLE